MKDLLSRETSEVWRPQGELTVLRPSMLRKLGLQETFDGLQRAAVALLLVLDAVGCFGCNRHY